MIRRAAFIALLVAATGCGSPSRSPAPAPTEPDREPAAASGPGGREESALSVLESAAGLDSRLKRTVERWDTQVEAGLRVQATARLAGPEALEGLLAKLRARPDRTPVDAYLIGRLEGKLGRVAEARKAFREALALDKRFLWAHEGLAICLGQVADVDPGRGPAAFADPEAVEAEIDRAFAIWSTFPRGWLVLGQLHLQRLDPQRALDELTKIPEDHPAYRDAVLTKARCQMMLRKPELAVSALRAVLEKEPDNVEWLAQLGSALIELRDVRAARDVFERAAKLAPKHVPTRLGLAHTAELAGQQEDAHRGYQSLVSDPAVPANVRRDALDGMRRIETGRRPGLSLSTLLVTLRDSPDAEKRREAAALLWQVRDEAVLRVFVRRLNPRVEPDERIRVYAVRALSGLDAQRFYHMRDVFVALIDPAREPSKLVRGLAVRQLGRFPAEVAPLDAMAGALADPEPYVFAQARAALEQSTEHRELPSLQGELDEASRARVLAAWRAWIERYQKERR